MAPASLRRRPWRLAVAAAAAVLCVLAPAGAAHAQEWKPATLTGWSITNPDTGRIYEQLGTRWGFEMEQFEEDPPLLVPGDRVMLSYYAWESMAGASAKAEVIVTPANLRLQMTPELNVEGYAVVLEIPEGLQPSTRHRIDVRTAPIQFGSGDHWTFGSFTFDTPAAPPPSPADPAPSAPAGTAPSAGAGSSAGADPAAPSAVVVTPTPPAAGEEPAPGAAQPATPATPAPPAESADPVAYMPQPRPDNSWLWPLAAAAAGAALVAAAATAVARRVLHRRRLDRLGASPAEASEPEAVG